MRRARKSNIVVSIPDDVWDCLSLDEQSILLLLDDRLNERFDNNELKKRLKDKRILVQMCIEAGKVPIGWMPGGTP